MTIILDGKMKDVVDLIMRRNPDYQNETELIRDAIFRGINAIIKGQN